MTEEAPHTHLETMVRITTQRTHSPLENRKGIQEKRQEKAWYAVLCAGIQYVLIRFACCAAQHALFLF